MPAKSSVRTNVREQIANRLRDDILAGRLAEGDHLSEVRLAERFEVSRGPVREALVQLSHEGLLVSKPNCGVRVAPPAPNSIRKLVTPIRRTIETYALQLVYDDLTDDDFQAFDGFVDRIRAATARGDTAAVVEQDIAFHRFILERAGQPDLIAIWTMLVARIRRHFQQSHGQRTKPTADAEARHRALVDAFRAGDKEAAVRALEEHIA